MTTPADLAKRILRREWDHLTAQERRVIESIQHRVAVSRDPSRAADDSRTFGERLSDAIAGFGGSWMFIILFLAFLAVWTGVNAFARDRAPDPYPFIFLNLLLSMVAALQAPLILMSQNRQAARDRQQAEADYEVNLKAEIEIRNLHEKLDLLRESQWADLVAMQRDQIEKLERLLAAKG